MHNHELIYDFKNILVIISGLTITFPQVKCDKVKCQKGPIQVRISYKIFRHNFLFRILDALISKIFEAFFLTKLFLCCQNKVFDVSNILVSLESFEGNFYWKNLSDKIFAQCYLLMLVVLRGARPVSVNLLVNNRYGESFKKRNNSIFLWYRRDVGQIFLSNFYF